MGDYQLSKMQALGAKLHKELEEYMRQMEKALQPLKALEMSIPPRHAKSMMGLSDWLPLERKVRPSVLNGTQRDFFLKRDKIALDQRAIYRMTPGGLRYPETRHGNRGRVTKIKWKLCRTLTPEQLHVRIVNVAKYHEEGKITEEEMELLLTHLNGEALRSLQNERSD